jgi:heme oxygenase
MMGGMATKSLKLEDGQGIAFYRFDDIPNPKDFIEGWYANLNSLDLTEAQKQAIVDEGNEVFRLNIDILEELEGNGVLTAFKFALDSLWTSIKSKFQG